MKDEKGKTARKSSKGKGVEVEGSSTTNGNGKADAEGTDPEPKAVAKAKKPSVATPSGLTPLEDLKKSGLSDETIAAMQVTYVSAERFEQMGLEGSRGGYEIPFFDFRGNKINHSRFKLLPPVNRKGREMKYWQPKGTPNHGYVPPLKGITEADWMNPNLPVAIVEGEKKAAAGAQEGILCLGISGIANWRKRLFKIDSDKVEIKGDSATFKLDKTEEIGEVQEQVIQELMAIPREGRKFYIVPDSDWVTNENVQREAFEFNLWLQSEGAIPICVGLPNKPNPGKMGLDDYLLSIREAGMPAGEAFISLPTVIPQHPQHKSWIKNYMDRSRLKRSDFIKIANSIVNRLDHAGQRYVDQAGKFYYFDRETKVLYGFKRERVGVLGDLRTSEFGNFLDSKFGVNMSDVDISSRFADAFSAKSGILRTQPRTLAHVQWDALYFQLNNSQMARASKDGIMVLDNGSDGVLFEAGVAKPIENFGKLFVGYEEHDLVLLNLWKNAIETTNLQPCEGMTLEETVALMTTLFYISPLLKGWRGMMVPLELYIAEPGSGKSFLMNLRKAVLTGNPSLDNQPSNSRDWYAQITNAPLIWICDNMGNLPPDFRNQFSDELARLITDPEPKISMRKFYTEADVKECSIGCGFVITAIRNPLSKDDILQRSIIFNMRAIEKKDGEWYRRWLGKDGESRSLWVLDHLIAASKFFKAVAGGEWKDRYESQHRLVHFEQSLLVMGKVLGFGEAIEGAVGKLLTSINDSIISNDPIAEALRTFIQEFREGKNRNAIGTGPEGLVSAADIKRWVETDKDDRYQKVRALESPVGLGKWISNHRNTLETALGVEVINIRKTNYLKIERDDTK